MEAGLKLSKYCHCHVGQRRERSHLPPPMTPKAFCQAELSIVFRLWRNGGRLALVLGLVSKLLSCILLAYLTVETFFRLSSKKR